MTAIYQSPFLLALGWAIAASLWQTALLWMIYQAATGIYRKASPAAKHNTALAMIVVAFGWFCLTLVDTYNEFSLLLQQRHAILPDSIFNANGDPRTSDNLLLIPAVLIGFMNQYLPYISAAYLIVLVLLAVRLVKAYAYSQHLKTNGLVAIEEQWSRKIDLYAKHLNIGKKISIYLSHYIDVPATINYFKPLILLPVATFNHLTTQQVESILLHELAHIKRNDFLINIIVSVIETVLFFNPFVLLLGKTLKREREHCCDDFVLQYRFDPHSYASALLSLEQLRMRVTPAAAIAATGNSNQLLGRVKRIMNVKSSGFNYGQKLLALVITAFILISIAWLSPASTENKKSDETKTAIKTQPVADMQSTQTTIAAKQSAVVAKRAKQNPVSSAKSSPNTARQETDAIGEQTEDAMTITGIPEPPDPVENVYPREEQVFNLSAAPDEADQYFKAQEFDKLPEAAAPPQVKSLEKKSGKVVYGEGFKNLVGAEGLLEFSFQKDVLSHFIFEKDALSKMQLAEKNLKLLSKDLQTQQKKIYEQHLFQLNKNWNDVRVQYQNAVGEKIKSTKNAAKDRDEQMRANRLLNRITTDAKIQIAQPKLKTDSLNKQIRGAKKQKTIWVRAADIPTNEIPPAEAKQYVSFSIQVQIEPSRENTSSIKTANIVDSHENGVKKGNLLKHTIAHVSNFKLAGAEACITLTGSIASSPSGVSIVTTGNDETINFQQTKSLN